MQHRPKPQRQVNPASRTMYVRHSRHQFRRNRASQHNQTPIPSYNHKQLKRQQHAQRHLRRQLKERTNNPQPCTLSTHQNRRRLLSTNPHSQRTQVHQTLHQIPTMHQQVHRQPHRQLLIPPTQPRRPTTRRNLTKRVQPMPHRPISSSPTRQPITIRHTNHRTIQQLAKHSNFSLSCQRASFFDTCGAPVVDKTAIHVR